MAHSLRGTTLAALLVVLAGCGRPSFNAGGPFGAPRSSQLLAPFAGDWVLDFERTLEAQRKAGVPEATLDMTRKFAVEHPEFGKPHWNMKINGDEAISTERMASEYRFFAMHMHDGKVCGKAWHHEDRYDPGDMSKCYVRLSMDDDRLVFEVRNKDGLPSLNDPDLAALPPVESGSPESCTAESDSDPDWSEWMVYVFAKKK